MIIPNTYSSMQEDMSNPSTDDVSQTDSETPCEENEVEESGNESSSEPNDATTNNHTQETLTIDNENVENFLKSESWCTSIPIEKVTTKELRGFLGTRSISVFVGTWNMQGKSTVTAPTLNLNPFLVPGHHIYAIGTQECEASIGKSIIFSHSKTPWEDRVGKELGQDYILLRSNVVGAMHLGVWILKELSLFINNITSGSVVTGLGNVVANKGGVGIGFNLSRSSFLFVSSHFAAHHKNIAQRNGDFHRINNLLMQDNFSSNSHDKIHNSDATLSPPINNNNDLIPPLAIPKPYTLQPLKLNSTKNSTTIAPLPKPHSYSTPSTPTSKSQLPPLSPKTHVSFTNSNPVFSNSEPPTLPNSISQSSSTSFTSSNSSNNPPVLTSRLPPLNRPFSAPLSRRVSRTTSLIMSPLKLPPINSNTLNKRNTNNSTTNITPISPVLNNRKQEDSRHRSLSIGSTPISSQYDHVFWFGDLNYRINGTRVEVEQLVNQGSKEDLIENDQLTIEMKKGTVFRDFSEGPLNFPPSYKYDKGSDTYDTSSKARIPSWTDRILFKSSDKITQKHYGCCQEIKFSDHRPVAATFEVMFNMPDVLQNDPSLPTERNMTIGSEKESKVCLIM